MPGPLPRSNPGAAAAFDLLETLKWDPSGGWMLLDRHLDRLLASAAFFHVPANRSGITATLDESVAHRTDAARVRLLLSPDGRPRCEVQDLPVHAGPWRIALAAAPVVRGDLF